MLSPSKQSAWQSGHLHQWPPLWEMSSEFWNFCSAFVTRKMILEILRTKKYWAMLQLQVKAILPCLPVTSISLAMATASANSLSLITDRQISTLSLNNGQGPFALTIKLLLLTLIMIEGTKSLPLTVDPGFPFLPTRTGGREWMYSRTSLCSSGCLLKSPQVWHPALLLCFVTSNRSCKGQMVRIIAFALRKLLRGKLNLSDL